MKRFLWLISLVALGTLGVSSCSKNNDACANNAISATLRNLTGLDGCSWVLELKDGRRLEPLNLSDQKIALVDGLPVWVDYSVAKNAMSICMVGEIVTINCISER